MLSHLRVGSSAYDVLLLFYSSPQVLRMPHLYCQFRGSIGHKEASAWSLPRSHRTGQGSWMGCTSSKAFKGEGHRLGTAVTASSAAPPNGGGQRIAPTTAVSKPQATKPTNKTDGSGSNDNMRGAAARAAEQRAESVSSAVLSLTSQRGPHDTVSPRSSHSRFLTASPKRHEHCESKRWKAIR